MMQITLHYDLIAQHAMSHNAEQAHSASRGGLMTDTARHPADTPGPSSSEQRQEPGGKDFLMPQQAGLLTTAAGNRAAPVRTYDRVFPATASQVGEARRFLAAALVGCPVADDAVLCLSELASNSVLHSNSKKTGGTFTVRAQVRDGDYLWLEVEDNGGSWEECARRDSRPHGLDIIRALATDCGRDGDAYTGWVMWARLDWPAPANHHQPVPPVPQR
jgi:Histidine kinase-like ATPase domain